MGRSRVYSTNAVSANRQWNTGGLGAIPGYE
jgi:hypothetical protein